MHRQQHEPVINFELIISPFGLNQRSGDTPHTSGSWQRILYIGRSRICPAELTSTLFAFQPNQVVNHLEHSGTTAGLSTAGAVFTIYDQCRDTVDIITHGQFLGTA